MFLHNCTDATKCDIGEVFKNSHCDDEDSSGANRNKPEDV